MPDPNGSARVSTVGIDPDTFRQVMGSLPTGITVVTTRDLAGQPQGTTVNACISVSLEPPLLLVSLGHESRTLEHIRQKSSFAVNILSADQEWVARRFAGRTDDKFAGVPHRIGRLGLPLIEGVAAHAECEVADLVTAGDHTLVIGLMLEGQAWARRPLLYFHRHFAAWPGPM